ncbi:unnamed protein product [Brassica oleracea var. botrytis]|uniref:(rape) hypothetical protein n=1 Tax=Brassica napus TaxID=3708 RepID=A0A816J4W7_BRANA|nr:unnamed protein product [Brassica napus]
MWFFSAMNNYTATKSLGLIVVKLADMLLLDEKDPETRRSTKIPDNADVVIEFLDKNDFDLICQGHQVRVFRWRLVVIFTIKLVLLDQLVSLFLVYEAHLGYIIEDVHPNGSIKKIKSSVYSNLSYTFQFIISFRLRYISTGSPIQSFSKLREAARGHLSRLQGIWSPCSDQVAVELNTHSCCMCGRTHSCCKAADSVGTSPEPTTKKPVRCNNLE